MVGSEIEEDEAVGMMALHESLRTVCLNSEWVYSVFWTTRPRPRVRCGYGCKSSDENGTLMLMWEDGFLCTDEMDGENENPVKRAFIKMSIQLYNYGEGLMGKVAADKCHKWIFKQPVVQSDDPGNSSYWRSSFDALSPEWIEQFDAGIQTIAVIQAGHGLLQLGSCKIIPEDLHFVLKMRQTFESLAYQSGFYLSQLFSSARNALSPSPNQPSVPIYQPQHVFWKPRPILSTNRTNNFQASAPLSKDEQVMVEHHDGDEIKWPTGLSFVNALTGRTDASKLPFLPEGHNEVQDELLTLEKDMNATVEFKSSFGFPGRIVTSSSSLDFHGGRFRNEEGGVYSDGMEALME